MHTMDLATLERKAFTSTYQDGLTDLYVGVVMLLPPLSALFPYIGVTDPQVGTALRIGLLLAVCGVFMIAKRVITVPRLGRVEFGKRRKSREKRLWLIMAVSVSISILLMLLTTGVLRGRFADLGSVLERPGYIGAFVAANVFVIFSFIAYFMDFTRAYLIGAVFAVGLGFDITCDQPIPLVLGGLLFLVIGTVHFVGFIRTCPLPRESNMEDADGRV